MAVSKKSSTPRQYKRTSGHFISCKMNTSVWYESILQRDFMYWLEFNPDVVSYTTLIEPLKYYDKGKEKLYYPDFQVIRHQKKQVIDLKFQKAIKSTGKTHLNEKKKAVRMNLGKSTYQVS